MKNKYRLAPKFYFNVKAGLMVALTALAQQAFADVSVNLNLWRGYNTFYGQVTMTVSSPAPVTYHRVESPNGAIWRERSTTINDGSFTNLSFSTLMDECTNGVWTLIRNVGHASAQTNTFSVSLTGVTSAMFGDITMVDPLYGQMASTNPPELQWSSTSTFPEIYVYVSENDAPYTFGDSAFLPGNATSWTPSATLTTADQVLLIQYQTNHFAGANFNLIAGPAITGWNPSATLMSYLYSVFILPGGSSELDVAVESPGLSWTTGGDGGHGWFVQTYITSVGDSALQSGDIYSYYDTSWIETTVMGPGSLYFDWNILAGDNDAFEFSATDEDDNEFDWFVYEGYEVFGLDFYNYEVTLQPGPNTLRWTFYNNDIDDGDYNAAFLDNVKYYPEIDYEAAFNLEIQRVTQGTNEYYLMFPSFNYTYPNPITTHEVASPNWRSTGSDYSSSSAHYATLQGLINEIESGDWTLSFNVDSPGGREYTFNITVDALSTNDMPLATILKPLANAVGVATNTGYLWTGPASFDSLAVYARDIEANTTLKYSSLPVAATSWPTGPTLPPGTNSFDITYTSNDFTGLTISTPTDWDSNYLYNWSASVAVSTGARARFVVSSGFVPLSVALLQPTIFGGDFGLSFLSQSGATHTVQSTTNLVTGPWQPITNFTGTGVLELLALPMTNSAAFYRVETQ